MRLLLFFLALFRWSAAYLPAQQTEGPVYSNTLTVIVGLNRGYFKDANYSPLNYTAPGTHFGLSYARNTAAGNRWNAGIGFDLGTLKSDADYPAHKTDRYRVDLSVGYLKGLAGNTEDRRFHIGANYRSYVDIVLYDGEEAVTFFGLHAFEGAAAGAWNVGKKQRFSAGASLPIFGLLARPPYTGWDKYIVENSGNIPGIVTRGKWTSLNDFFGIRANMGWEYAVKGRWAVGANYGLSYYTTRILDPVRHFDNTFSVSNTLRF